LREAGVKIDYIAGKYGCYVIWQVCLQDIRQEWTLFLKARILESFDLGQCALEAPNILREEDF